MEISVHVLTFLSRLDTPYLRGMNSVALYKIKIDEKFIYEVRFEFCC